MKNWMLARGSPAADVSQWNQEIEKSQVVVRRRRDMLALAKKKEES